MSTKTTAAKAQSALHAALTNPAWLILVCALVAAALILESADAQLANAAGTAGAALFGTMVLVAAADLILDTVNERRAR